MKKNLRFILSMIVVIIIFSSFSTAVLRSENKFLNKDKKGIKRVIVKNVNQDKLNKLKYFGCRIKHKLDNAVSFECPEDVVLGDDLKKERIFHITDLDSAQQINTDDIWALGITGKGINIAILDTGIDIDHPDLVDSYISGFDFVNSYDSNGDGDYDDPGDIKDEVPEDEHNHGTHVSGIITSDNPITKGVSPDSGIYMFKVCNKDGNCYESDMMKAMEMAAETDAKILSMSIGGAGTTDENCDSDILAQKINWLVENGITAVISSGNDGQVVSSPACASKAIAVGAVDSDKEVPYWSGRGDALDILAPGNRIYSTIINGNAFSQAHQWLPRMLQELRLFYYRKIMI
ncbi:S8 family serine peptidase [Candidatus Woesearchaeota archaeon]|nr:S8 family serine peptidase [Candidatus Woesearchaeota archaeon]